MCETLLLLSCPALPCPALPRPVPLVLWPHSPFCPPSSLSQLHWVHTLRLQSAFLVSGSGGVCMMEVPAASQQLPLPSAFKGHPLADRLFPALNSLSSPDSCPQLPFTVDFICRRYQLGPFYFTLHDLNALSLIPCVCPPFLVLSTPAAPPSSLSLFTSGLTVAALVFTFMQLGTPS